MKVIPTLLVPAAGVAAGVVNANVPGTEAVPPVRVAPERGVLYVMLPAVGRVLMVGVACATLIDTVPVVGK